MPRTRDFNKPNDHDARREALIDCVVQLRKQLASDTVSTIDKSVELLERSNLGTHQVQSQKEQIENKRIEPFDSEAEKERLNDRLFEGIGSRVRFEQAISKLVRDITTDRTRYVDVLADYDSVRNLLGIGEDSAQDRVKRTLDSIYSGLVDKLGHAIKDTSGALGSSELLFMEKWFDANRDTMLGLGAISRQLDAAISQGVPASQAMDRALTRATIYYLSGSAAYSESRAQRALRDPHVFNPHLFTLAIALPALPRHSFAIEGKNRSMLDSLRPFANLLIEDGMEKREMVADTPLESPGISQVWDIFIERMDDNIDELELFGEELQLRLNNIAGSASLGDHICSILEPAIRSYSWITLIHGITDKDLLEERLRRDLNGMVNTINSKSAEHVYRALNDLEPNYAEVPDLRRALNRDSMTCMTPDKIDSAVERIVTGMRMNDVIDMNDVVADIVKVLLPAIQRYSLALAAMGYASAGDSETALDSLNSLLFESRMLRRYRPDSEGSN